MPRYRVYCPRKQQKKELAGLNVEQSYPAFAVVNTTAKDAGKLRKKFPVEKLAAAKQENPEASALAAASSAASTPGKTKGDMLVRFIRDQRPFSPDREVVRGCSGQTPFFTRSQRCHNE